MKLAIELLIITATYIFGSAYLFDSWAAVFGNLRITRVPPLIFILLLATTLLPQRGGAEINIESCLSTVEGLALESSSLLTSSQSKPFWQLSQDIEGSRPRIIDQVNSKLDQYHPLATGEKVLCGAVCGRASKAIRSILDEQGYKYKQYITYRLSDRHMSQDHTFIVVDLEGKEVIVDGAYLRFLDVLGLDPQNTPQHDILIMSYDRLEKWLDYLVYLRKKQEPLLLAEYGPTHGMGPHPNFYDLSDTEAKEYFREIWDFKSQIYKEKTGNE